MATINISGRYMAQKFAEVIGFLNSPEQAAQNKYLGEVFMLELSQDSVVGLMLNTDYPAKGLAERISFNLTMEDDPDANKEDGVGWFKRIKNFGLERKIYTDAHQTDNIVSITNPLQTRTKTVNSFSHTFNPIFIHSIPNKKIDHIGFFKVVEKPQNTSGVAYKLIMLLQITELGKKDILYGDLFHLKELTLYFH